MAYLFGLAAALAALWFALSTERSVLFLLLAALSVLVSLWLAARLSIIDRTGSPYHRLLAVLAYSPWLAIEVVKSNIAVLRAIAGPRHALQPSLAQTKTRAQTDLGKAVFANSITLTPGTVTLDVDEGRVTVHALDGPSAIDGGFAEMDRRATAAAERVAGKG